MRTYLFVLTGTFLQPQERIQVRFFVCRKFENNEWLSTYKTEPQLFPKLAE